MSGMMGDNEAVEPFQTTAKPMAYGQNFHCRIGFARERCAGNSSIIGKGVLQKTIAFVPLAGSVRRRRSRRYDFQQRPDRQADSADALGVQLDLLGDHPNEMESSQTRTRAKRSLRSRVPQGPTLAGYCRGGRPIQAQPFGRSV